MKKVFDKEPTERDALNRILWDKSLDPKDFVVDYVDRFRSELSKIRFSDARLEGDFLIHGESVIPLHRVRRISHKGVIVWEKRRV